MKIFTHFDNDELEMAMITYNRPSFVKEWLDSCCQKIIDFNILLSIYDSSENEDTRDIVNDYNKICKGYIKYVRLPSSTTGGYKYLYPILETKAKYLMVVGDSRCHSMEGLAKNVFPNISSKYDLIVLSYYNDEKNDKKEFNDLESFLEECFIPITCCGFTIFNMNVFALLRNDKREADRLNSLYRDKYGFAYLGYYLDCYSKSSKKSILLKSPWKELSSMKKHAYWHSQFYECWCDELCQIMDSISDEYGDKDSVLKKTWKRLELDAFDRMIRIKESGALKYSDYKRMKKFGYLRRVTDRSNTFCFVTMMPVFILKIIRKIQCLFK